MRAMRTPPQRAPRHVRVGPSHAPGRRGRATTPTSIEQSKGACIIPRLLPLAPSLPLIPLLGHGASPLCPAQSRAAYDFQQSSDVIVVASNIGSEAKASTGLEHAARSSTLTERYLYLPRVVHRNPLGAFAATHQCSVNDPIRTTVSCLKYLALRCAIETSNDI